MLLLIDMMKSLWKFFLKPIKSIRIKVHLDISIMDPLGIKNLINTERIISKGLLKTRSNSDPKSL
jgi:hypothetical protein